MLSFLKKTIPAGLVLISLGMLAGCTTGQEKVAKLTAEAEKGNVDSMVEIAVDETCCGKRTYPCTIHAGQDV